MEKKKDIIGLSLNIGFRPLLLIGNSCIKKKMDKSCNYIIL